MKVLLDSSILIECIKKKIDLVKTDQYFINPIIFAEVGYGFLKVGRNLDELQKWIMGKHIEFVEIGLSTAKIYTVLKLGLRHNLLEEKDLLISASAVEHNFKLWTLNKKDFERVKEIELV